jgi:hypothetical protein
LRSFLSWRFGFKLKGYIFFILQSFLAHTDSLVKSGVTATFKLLANITLAFPVLFGIPSNIEDSSFNRYPKISVILDAFGENDLCSFFFLLGLLAIRHFTADSFSLELGSPINLDECELMNDSCLTDILRSSELICRSVERVLACSIFNNNYV